MKPILAVDYGTKRIGLAISKGNLADPLIVLENNDDFFTKIKEICHQKDIGKIILGLSENKMAEQIKDFAKQLKAKLDIPIYFFDETLSSQQARKKLLIAKAKKKKRQGPVDHFAAALFLEEWLELNPQV